MAYIKDLVSYLVGRDKPIVVRQDSRGMVTIYRLTGETDLGGVYLRDTVWVSGYIDIEGILTYPLVLRHCTINATSHGYRTPTLKEQLQFEAEERLIELIIDNYEIF